MQDVCGTEVKDVRMVMESTHVRFLQKTKSGTTGDLCERYVGLFRPGNSPPPKSKLKVVIVFLLLWCQRAAKP